MRLRPLLVPLPAIAAVGLGVLAAVVLIDAPSDPAPSAAPTPPPLTGVWPGPGVIGRFTVSLRAAESTALAGTVVSGALKLDGLVVVRGLEPDAAGRARTAWSLARVDDASLSLLGAAADKRALASLLVGPELVATHDEDGGVAAVFSALPRGAPPPDQAFVHAMRSLVLEANVSLPQHRAGWSDDERTPRGVARSAYLRDGNVVTRTRTAYVRLDALPRATATSAVVDSNTTLFVDDEGLVALESDETVAGAGGASAFGTLTLERVDSGTGDARAPVALVSADPSSPREDVAAGGAAGQGALPSQDVRALEAQAAGVDGEDVRRTFAVFGSSGALPDENRFVWAASARVALEPAVGDALVDAMGGFSSRGRGLVLDVLASAGTPAAQASMVRALTRADVRGDRDASLLVGRLGLVEEPAPETLAFLEEQARAHDGASQSWTRGAMFALGGAVGSAARAADAAAEGERGSRAGDDPSAAAAWRRGHHVLLDALASARSETERSLALRALGNAGIADDDAVIAGAARTRDPRMRLAAALGLRKVDTPLARDALFDLAGDADADVQARALRSLAARPLSAGDIADLGALAAAGRIAPDASAAFIDLVAARLVAPTGDDDDLAPAAEDALRALLAQRPVYPDIEARLRLILHDG